MTTTMTSTTRAAVVPVAAMSSNAVDDSLDPNPHGSSESSACRDINGTESLSGLTTLPPPRTRGIRDRASEILRIAKGVAPKSPERQRGALNRPNRVLHLSSDIAPSLAIAYRATLPHRKPNMGQGSWIYSDLAPSFFSTSSDTAIPHNPSSTAPQVHLLPSPPASTLTHHAFKPDGSPTGKYVNPWPSWQSFSFSDLYDSYLKGATLRRPPREDEEEDAKQHGRLVRVVRPDWEGLEGGLTTNESGRQELVAAGKGRTRRKERICWLGHAGVLMQIPRESRSPSGSDIGEEAEGNYIGVVFDPIFSKRCSPSQYIGPSRKLDAPCAIHELPPIHVCCISHDHYDHLDYHTIIGLWRMNREEIRFFVPLGVKKWFLSCGIPPDQIVELDWHQEALVHFPSFDIDVTSTDPPSVPPPLSRSDSMEGLDKPDIATLIRGRSDLQRTSTTGSDLSYTGRSSSGSSDSGWQSDGSESRTPLVRTERRKHPMQPSMDSLGYPPSLRRAAPSPPQWTDGGLTLKIVCTPAQHRSGRGLTDQMSTLWCSWIVGVLGDLEDHREWRPASSGGTERGDWRWRKGFTDGDGFRAFFAGDTGFRYAGAPDADAMTTICPAFRDIASRYGPVDLSFLPISTGSSLSFLRKLLGISLHHYSLTSSQHCNAWDAIQISRMMGSKATLAIHHSTFSPEDESRGCIYEFDHTREDEDVPGQWGEEGCFVVSNIGEVLEMSVKPKQIGSHVD